MHYSRNILLQLKDISWQYIHILEISQKLQLNLLTNEPENETSAEFWFYKLFYHRNGYTRDHQEY